MHRSNVNPARSLAGLLLMAVLGTGLGACQTAGTSRVESQFPVYPTQLNQSQALDIHALRDGTRVELTNSTSTAFGPSRLWINRWYSREIDALAVGQTLDLSLSDFKDQYGEEFRAGGFFATRKPDRLVLLQIESNGAMYGVVTAVNSDTK